MNLFRNVLLVFLCICILSTKSIVSGIKNTVQTQNCVNGKPERNQFLANISKTTTIEGFPCKNWNDMAFGEFSDDYSDDSSSHCQNYPPHADRYGPWCFFHQTGFYELTWQPCFPSCMDLERDALAQSHADCYWPVDLPKGENGYNGNRRVAFSSKSQDLESSKNYSCSLTDYGSDSYSLKTDLCRIRTDSSSSRDERLLPWCNYKDASGAEIRGDCFFLCEAVLQYKKIDSSKICIPTHRLLQGGFTSDFSCRYSRSINNYRCKKPGTPVSGKNKETKIFKEIGPHCEIEPTEAPDWLKKEACFDRCEDRSGNELFQGFPKICVGLQKLLSYRGTRRRSLTGRKCLHWLDPEIVRKGGRTFELKQLRVSEFWMVANFCRNPDADLNGPWCYVLGSNDVLIREACFDHCRFAFDDDTEPEIGPPSGGDLAIQTMDDKQYFEDVLEMLKRNGTEKDKEKRKKIDTQKYIIYASSALCGFIVIYVVFVVIGIFSYEWIKRCLAYRKLLGEMKEKLEEGPGDDPNQEVIDAYMKVLEEYKKLLNVAKHSYNGRLLEGWEEFDDVKVKIQSKPKPKEQTQKNYG